MVSMFTKCRKADASFPWSGLDVSYQKRVLNAVKGWSGFTAASLFSQFVFASCMFLCMHVAPFLTTRVERLVNFSDTRGWQLLCNVCTWDHSQNPWHVA